LGKGPFVVKEIKALPPGQQVWGKFLVLDKVYKKTKDGKNMYNLTIGDGSGDMNAVVWDNCAIAGTVETGAVIGLLGDVGVFANRVQITAKRIKCLEEDPALYLKVPSISVDELRKRLEEISAQVQDASMQKLLKRILTPEIKQKFMHAPAAKKVHHNYGGGLLEHTVSVAEMCIQACRLYKHLNQDLLITGAILHDVGKINEYAIKAAPEYTVAGRLIGHIVMGNDLIAGAVAELRAEGEEFSPELEWMLKHMILSHHGSLEFGSPVKPLFPEAMVLHIMDDLDARMFVYFHKIDEDESEDPFFTPYDSFFAQNFFKYRYPAPKAEDPQE
jgi:3'-5' exoribonuclease